MSNGRVSNCWEGSCGVLTSDETGERTSDAVAEVCDRWWEGGCGETGKRMGIRGLGGCLDAVVQSPVRICLLSTFVDCGVGEVVDDESVEFFGGACPGLHGGADSKSVVCDG